MRLSHTLTDGLTQVFLPLDNSEHLNTERAEIPAGGTVTQTCRVRREIRVVRMTDATGLLKLSYDCVSQDCCDCLNFQMTH